MEVIINQYDIIERLDDIINNLQELRDVSEGKEKEQKLKETVAMVQKLEPELTKRNMASLKTSLMAKRRTDANMVFCFF